MSNQLQDDGSFVNSIVGEGTAFQGNLELEGLLRIDGDFTGTIRTAGKVLVGINGRAECTISAGTVVIGGVVKGNIYADEKVLVLSTGMMIGNINTPRLIAEEGVVLHGSCLVQRQKERSDSFGGEAVNGKRVAGVIASGEKVDDRTAAEDGDVNPGRSDSAGEAVYTGAPEGNLDSWKG